MKFLGAVFIIISSSMIGISMSESLRKRVILLNSLYCLLNDFSISIQYTAPTVWQLMENAYNNPEFNNIKFVKAFHNEISDDVPFTQLWNTCIAKDYSLKYNEREILYSVGNSLGKVGCEESVSNLHLAMERLKHLHIQSIDEYSKKGNLFRWLGILLGIAISIMLV